MPEEADHQNPVFVRRFVVLRGQTPARAKLLAVVKSQRDIGITDVDCQQHVRDYTWTIDDLRLTIDRAGQSSIINRQS
jgi:hypothetical protein